MTKWRARTVLPILLLSGILVIGTWFGRVARPHLCTREHNDTASESAGVLPMSDRSTLPKHLNRLSHESSPYLQQHAANPVDWYPWSDEALARAKAEDKPIFLSIGYSSCHWCHVMESESFANEEVAALLKKYFIAIKVDREERPDIDAIYMVAVQRMTGSGGWPLSVFLTPDGRPFYGGTYFPPEDHYGRPGFKRLLTSVADAWENRRDELLQSADHLTTYLTSLEESPSGQADEKLLSLTYKACQQIYDPKQGGFGEAPKFPQPVILDFLLRTYHRSKDPEALEMVEKTLMAMYKGGVYDHLGGGFHRYATDQHWMVPHFEKMLYDQAQIVHVYLDAYRVTGKAEYAQVVHEVLTYVLRDMTDPQGGFYSAEDADSEGHEGIFYVWTPDEVDRILPASQAAVFKKAYGISAQGNFEHQTTILHRACMPTSEADKVLLTQACVTMLAHRNKRERPFRDDKVITAWNGLMLGSFAEAGRCLGEPRYLEAAEKSADFLLKQLRLDGRLQRAWRQGKVSGAAYLDDYAFFIDGLLKLYGATFNTRWFLAADHLAKEMVGLFHDNKDGGGLFFVGHDEAALVVRNKTHYDGALPSGNSIAASVLFRLSRITTNAEYEKQAQAIVDAAVQAWQMSPMSRIALASALDYALGPAREVTFVGDSSQPNAKAMMADLSATYRPNTLALYRPAEDVDPNFTALVPYLAKQKLTHGRFTAFVCSGQTCSPPVDSVEDFKALLAPSGEPPQ